MQQQNNDVVVEVSDLRIDLPHGGDDIVAEVCFKIRSGEIVGLVGESGSGKTTVSMALLGFARGGARIARGQVVVGTDDLIGRSEAELRRLRGRIVSYVPQDPSAALNPALRIRRQLTETIEAHEADVSEDEMDRRLVDLMQSVDLPSDREFLRRFPHQLSGGQMQRICIAMAVALRPKLVVLDEPTTGLDVATQSKILQTVRHLCTAFDIAALYVSHDLSVVADVADRVMVMYAGRIVEVADAAELFHTPIHPYSSALLLAVPDVRTSTHLAAIPGEAARPGHRPTGCEFHPRCDHAIASCASERPVLRTVSGSRSVRCPIPLTGAATQRPQMIRPFETGGSLVLRVRDKTARYGPAEVLRGVSFDLRANECLALVGESGSGKSTLSRCLIGLHPQQRGSVQFMGRELSANARRRTAEQRRLIQYVFQSPHSSLNPRRNVGDIIGLAYDLFEPGSRTDRRSAIAEALERVGLSSAFTTAFPDELSGGERQRVAISRALIVKPQIMICDEITSALDVSVQAAIMELLNGLKGEGSLSMLFVTHDLALVRNIADRVMVLDGGDVVEIGAAPDVLDSPQHSYTKHLLEHTLTTNR